MSNLGGKNPPTEGGGEAEDGKKKILRFHHSQEGKLSFWGGENLRLRRKNGIMKKRNLLINSKDF